MICGEVEKAKYARNFSKTDKIPQYICKIQLVLFVLQPHNTV